MFDWVSNPQFCKVDVFPFTPPFLILSNSVNIIPQIELGSLIIIGMGMGGCNGEERMVGGQVTHCLTTDPQLVVGLPTVSLV